MVHTLYAKYVEERHAADSPGRAFVRVAAQHLDGWASVAEVMPWRDPQRGVLATRSGEAIGAATTGPVGTGPEDVVASIIGPECSVFLQDREA